MWKTMSSHPMPRSALSFAFVASSQSKYFNAIVRRFWTGGVQKDASSLDRENSEQTSTGAGSVKQQDASRRCSSRGVPELRRDRQHQAKSTVPGLERF